LAGIFQVIKHSIEDDFELPPTDGYGQSEVVNRRLELYLRCLVHQQPRKWNSLLPWAKYWYNTTYHASTGRTPFQALYGRLPPTISHYQIGQSPVHEVNQQLLARDVFVAAFKGKLECNK
jgi:hypothetical protein